MNLFTPLKEEEIRKLKCGDIIYVSGTIFTARDQAHKRFIEYIKNERKLPIETRGLALFHCGPIVRKKKNSWIIVAAGPTTSTRMERFEADVIKNLGVRMIIGKGGMGDRTAEACREFGAVYCAYTGGVAVTAAKSVSKVKNVYWLDLGMPEALWVLEVKNFGPLVVAIDSNGENMFKEVSLKANKRKQLLLKEIRGT